MLMVMERPTPRLRPRIWPVLRKFGLDHADFVTIMENINVMLRVLTINIFNNSNYIPVIFYIFITIGTFAYFYVYILSIIWMASFYYGRAGNWTAMAIVLSLFACSITSFTKLIFMKLNSKNVKKLVEKFLQCHARVVPGTRFSKNLQKRLKTVKRRAISIWLFGMLNGVIYVLLPFVTPGRHFTTDLYVIYGLVPMFESPNFEIATTLNITSIAFGIYALVSIAAYILIVVGYIESQLLALSEELNTVWEDSISYYNVSMNKFHDSDRKEDIKNQFIGVRLRDILQLHIANVNLLHELDMELRMSLILEFSLITFAITAELLGGFKNTYLQLSYTILQIYMNCLAGQRLIDAGKTFEYSLYSCKWENFNVKNQRTVLIMLRMAQKTLVLSAGGIAKLDFACLMEILKSTYSAYTTLNSTVK